MAAFKADHILSNDSGSGQLSIERHNKLISSGQNHYIRYVPGRDISCIRTIYSVLKD
jgi:hypothetical protein